jgi:1-pyrroline-5-carboxylate dehydrogenase
MSNGIFETLKPQNEPIFSYAPTSSERKALKEELKHLQTNEIEIPLIIGGKEIRTGDLGECRCPHNHKHRLATYHKAGEKEIDLAIKAALSARKEWAFMPWEARLSIFLRAAELISTKYRMTLNAATMLGQSKNPFQAEIDSACELIDFLRFNSYYATEIYRQQPESAKGTWNRMEERPLEGFVFAVTPFNFTSIAGNLPTAPALMGNVVVWKPASSAVYPAYFFMKILKEAGLPDGVINFVAGPGSKVGKKVLTDPSLAGLHFTGSTATFQSMWRTIGENIHKYHTYPRIVGETGGKDFIVAHPSADLYVLNTGIIRGAFEYQGQKCSAASRAYLPETLWKELKPLLISTTQELKMGDVTDFSNFINAVIDKNAYDKIVSYIEYAKDSDEAEILCGGNYSDETGYFIEPTIIQTTNPHFKTMEEEIFGPVITVYIYPDNQYEEVLHLCDETSPYGLTGAIFAKDRNAIVKATEILTNAAGNFYINDKPTGAVVGQQPFGGSRASGTNDKAGSMINLMRWVSPRAIKENFVPSENYRYPFMDEK